ncbi:hypothetical protein L195_g009135, partial [Trifolium pratense]
SDLIAFISEAHQLHSLYTCTTLHEEVVAVEEIQVDGGYNGKGEVRGG